MAVTSTIGSVHLYTGSLLSLQAGGLLNVSVLNFGSGPLSATIVNDDAVLDQASNGVATAAINGGPALPLEYIGKGTAQPFTLLGLPLLAVPAVAFKAGEQVFVHFPNGPPPLSGLLISFNLNPGLGFPLPNPMPICLGAGARVATPGGPVPVEQLRPGDRVLTRDRGPMRLLWVGARRVEPEAQRQEPKLRPVRIPAGALGGGLPHRDLWVSRQHRMLVRAPGLGEVLVAAALLDGRQGIAAHVSPAPLTLHHLLLDSHAILYVEGTGSESLLPGAEALRALDPEARAALLAALPPGAAPTPARPLLRRNALRRLDRCDTGPVFLSGVAGPEAPQPAATRAVTSISNRMASSISRASIMVAAGRAVAKAAESCGQSRGKSARSGRM